MSAPRRELERCLQVSGGVAGYADRNCFLSVRDWNWWGLKGRPKGSLRLAYS